PRAGWCHTRAEIERAAELDLDFVVLGPVLPTPTHRGMPTLGWDGFAALAREAPLPIFALGGLAHEDLDTAIAHGAHGVALRRGAWIYRPESGHRHFPCRAVRAARLRPCARRFPVRPAPHPVSDMIRSPTRRGRSSCSARSRTGASATLATTRPPCRSADRGRLSA